MPITRATNLAGLGTVFDSLTDGGGLSVSGISTFTDLNITRVNITGVGTISNGSITNLTGTSSTITTFTSTNGSITNLTGTSSTITTLRSTTLNADTGNIVTGVITNFTSTNGSITNLTGTSSTITTLRSTTGNFTTGNIVTGVTTNFNSTNVAITGVTTVSTGTAALPSITPSGDPNTGIFFPSADHLNFSTGGTSRVQIESDGDINIDGGTVFVDAANNRFGVGTTSPGSPINTGKLMVQGGDIVVRDNNVGNSWTRGTLVFDVRNSNGDSKSAYIQSNITSDISSTIQFFTTISHALSERMRIDDAGRLLIGTTGAHDESANSILQLVGNLSNPRTLVFGRANNSPDEVLGSIDFISNAGVAARISGFNDLQHNANDFPGRLTFSTTADGGSSPTERMRISSDGNVQFGATLNFANVSGTLTGSGGATSWIGVKDSSNNFVFQAMTYGTGSGNLLVGYSVSNGAYKLQVNSQIFATSATIATSDGRYKENVASLGGCLDLVKALRPVSFTWKPQHNITRTDEDGNEVLVREGHNFPDGTQVGFIAQEVREVLAEKPWLTSIIKENVRPAISDDDGNEIAPKEEFLGIAEGNLIAVLTSALQEAVAEIQFLKDRVTALEGA